MTQSTTKPINVEQAVQTLRSACQDQSSGSGSASSHVDDITALLPSAAFLASHCTPALLTCLIDASDATAHVAGAPKKLSMLNAAWKLLLAVAAHDKVTPSNYETALVHMAEQLRWGVLTHDWSDKKRVRLATFFASHIVLAVRAHPRLLLSGTETARLFLGHLVRLYLTVCVTVATSTRDAEAVAALYDNIVNRLHGIFDCLGGAAAAMASSQVAGEDVATAAAAELHDDAEGSAAGDSPSCVAATVQALVAHCVSAAAAVEVEEAAGGGVRVRQATSTAGLSAYLHVVHGVLRGLPGGGGGNGADGDNEGEASASAAAAAVGEKGERPGGEAAGATAVDRSKTLAFLGSGLLAWTGQPALHGCDGSGERTATEQWECDATEAVVLRDIERFAASLPATLFAAPATAAPAGPPTLRATWVRALASLWKQWVSLCATSGAAGDAESDASSAGALACAVPAASKGQMQAAQGAQSVSLCAQLSAVVLSSLTSAANTSIAGLMALEAWTELLRQLDSSENVRSGTCPATVRVLLRVMAFLRRTATDLVSGLLCLRRRGGGDAAMVAPRILQWVCAIAALLSYNESALGVSGGDAVEDDDEARATACDIVSQLVEVVRAQSGAVTVLQREEETDNATRPTAHRATVAATEALRHLLTDLQLESSIARRQRPLTLAASFRLCRLLVHVPRKLRDCVDAFTASVNVPHSAVHEVSEEGPDVALLRLKQSLLSCSSLLAALTVSLQSLVEAPSAAEEEDDDDDDDDGQQAISLAAAAAHERSAGIARWVAARLLDEIATVPMTDSADDAVFLACVRRWTDVAFSSGPSPSAPLSAVRCGAAVVCATAAAALLRVAEECTTLDLETLNLSEDATAALMSLIEAGGESEEGEDAVGADEAVPWRRVLLGEEARQWHTLNSWAQRQLDVVAEERSTQDVAVALAAAPCDAATTHRAHPLEPSSAPPTAVDLLRGLRYCETVLQQLREGVARRSLVLMSAEDCAQGRKRRRLEEGRVRDKGAVLYLEAEESASVVRALTQIHAWSQSTLTQLKESGDSATPPPPPPPPPSSPPAEGDICARLEEQLRGNTQFFTLSDTESMGSRHRHSSAEVIDVE